MPTGTQAQPGDVVIIDPIPGHPIGHMAMMDNHGQWVSDFVQRGMYPGSAWRNMNPPPHFTLYRRK